MEAPRALGAAGNPSQQNRSGKPLQLSAQHGRLLQGWLARHPDLRPARMEDCEDRWRDSAGKEHVESCQRLVRELRAWTKNPDANPFYANGDFNGDRNGDFAVVLTDTRSSTAGAHPATVIVFNGPFRAAGTVEPTFTLPGRLVSETFLGYGPPRGKPWHLVIGLPESEGRQLVWRDGRYILR